MLATLSGHLAEFQSTEHAGDRSGFAH